MQTIAVDIETYSSEDIFSAGAYRYAQSPDFDILLMSYAPDTDHVTTIDLTQEAVPESAKQTLFDPAVRKRAFNAAFEWWCLSQYFGLQWEQRIKWLEQWECSALHMRYCGLPGKLEYAGKAMQLPEDKAKMREGAALIQYFCKPCKPTKANGGRTRNLPHHDIEKWKIFTQYNARDVVAEMTLDSMLAAWPVPEEINAQWRADIEMNAHGIGVDRDMTLGALACAEQITTRLMAEARVLTGLENPNSPTQLLGWLQNRGVCLDNMRKDTVAQLLAGETLPEDARRALEIRQQLGKTSNAKYDAIMDAIGEDDRIRGTLQFYGGNRTGRWAGRLLQVQNLPRTHLDGQAEIRRIITRRDVDSLEAIYGDVNDTLSQMIRTALVPQNGKWFLDADFNSIEARMIAWLAGEEWALQVFRTTGRIYEATAARIFDIPEDRIRKGNPEYAYRQRGKVATLALGYQGSVPAMRRMDTGHVLDSVSDAEVMDIVNRWREKNPAIRKLWGKMQRAAANTLRTGHASSPRPGVVFRAERSVAAPFPFLTMQLPSGRKLFYANPTISDDDRITYWEQDTYGWSQTDTYGGRLTENLTQAAARDCLEFALRNLQTAGYKVVFHVHDEVIVEIATQEPEAELTKIVEIMRRVPAWADGLPLNADGWAGRFYTKEG